MDRFDAFTQKPTSQYSLAYEKASIIFNISAVLSCHAANQNRSEDTGLKTAYHSFQASAGMFNYINENFLHAPSIDLSRETVKTLISIMLAQGQEVFLEKQIADGKKVGLLAKLASQAASLYAQAAEGIIEDVTKAIFERVWLLMTQIKCSYMSSLAQYYQALADADSNSHGTAIARLLVAAAQAKDASRVASGFPSSVPPSSNLNSETGSTLRDLVNRHQSNVQEKITSFTKENDFVYHQSVPAEASLSGVAKLPASKAIPVSELYQGQDIQRIIGPDIFQRIVPMSVTESASLYDEEKAKLVRAEAEKVEDANDEMAASLDYLKLPSSLDVLKGGMNQEVAVDEEFRGWCEELAGHESFRKAFEQLQSDKSHITNVLDSCSKRLDMEENVCEKMRVKYNADWTQQPSSRLNSTLRNDIKSYRGAIDEASDSDTQLSATARHYEADFEEVRSAGETDEADVLYQRAMIKAGGNRGKGKSGGGSISLNEGNLLDEDYGEGGTSVMDQIAKIEDLLKKMNLIKRDRIQVLKDLKEKVRVSKYRSTTISPADVSKVQADDISNVLILNKKSIANHESKLFEAELEKFRPHQNRLLQANHKQTALMKELTLLYGDLLQDKRVRSEQAKYESYTRQRNSVLSRYRKVYQAFNDLIAGLMRAQSFYSEMRETVDSLENNVQDFVNNRREEGGLLLQAIERTKATYAVGQSERERDRLRDMMERMNVNDSGSATNAPLKRTKSRGSRPAPLSHPPTATAYSHPAPPTSPPYNGVPQSHSNSYNFPPQPSPARPYPGYPPNNYPQPEQPPRDLQNYDPMQHLYQPRSPPPNLMYSPTHLQHLPQHSGQLPQGYVPPPPPPGPPPGQQAYPNGVRGYGGRQNNNAQAGQGDPWAGLGAWK